MDYKDNRIDRFLNLENGDVFSYKGAFYMKIPECTSNVDRMSATVWNAVLLTGGLAGELRMFAQSAEVEYVYTHLVIDSPGVSE